MTSDLPTRIASKISVSPVTGCWEWTGNKPGGYGHVWWQGKTQKVHRVVYTLLVGPIPDGAQIDHVRSRGCRSTACCWPEHLEPVSGKVNWSRGRSPTVAHALKDHCDAGHPFDEVNTYIRPSGGRQCRKCKREWKRQRRQELRAKSGWIPQAERTHCPAGHPYNEVNTYTKQGTRYCRVCGRESARRRRQQRTATRLATARSARAREGA